LLANGQRRNDTNRRETQADELHRLGAIIMTVGLRVSDMEGFRNGANRGGINSAAGNRHIQFIRLACIASIDGAIEAAATGVDAGTLDMPPSASMAEGHLENGWVGGRRRGVNGAHVVAP
jgi:hypothetical protein